MQPEVTVILTSSGRFDLLRKTIESFLLHNTYPINKWYINDDSGELIPKDLIKDFPFIEWKGYNLKNQINSLDYLWMNVQTPYAFQMEDDWLFTRPGFIEASMEIMEANPKILMVWLKELGDNNVHPVEWQPRKYPRKPDVFTDNYLDAYGIFKTSPNLWAWHRFNPSLKRLADYKLIAPFSKHTTFDPHKGWKSEAAISQVYNKLGFTAAILPEVYIKHLGEGRRVV